MLTPKTPRVDTHKASILYRLLLGHQIKNKEMWNHIDTGYAACRISELRAVVVKQYFIKSIHISELLKDQIIQDFIRKYEQYWMKKAG